MHPSIPAGGPTPMDIHEERHPGVPIERKPSDQGKCRHCVNFRRRANRNGLEFRRLPASRPDEDHLTTYGHERVRDSSNRCRLCGRESLKRWRSSNVVAYQQARHRENAKKYDARLGSDVPRAILKLNEAVARLVELEGTHEQV